jgi:hypothetical protein
VQQVQQVLVTRLLHQAVLQLVLAPLHLQHNLVWRIWLISAYE